MTGSYQADELNSRQDGQFVSVVGMDGKSPMIGRIGDMNSSARPVMGKGDGWNESLSRSSSLASTAWEEGVRPLGNMSRTTEGRCG